MWDRREFEFRNKSGKFGWDRNPNTFVNDRARSTIESSSRCYRNRRLVHACEPESILERAIIWFRVDFAPIESRVNVFDYRRKFRDGGKNIGGYLTWSHSNFSENLFRILIFDIRHASNPLHSIFRGPRIWYS